VLARVGAGLKIGFPFLNNSRHRHSCTIADSLVDTSAYVCLRVPAPRTPRSSLRRPFHNAPPVSHPHTHACTSSSCSASTPLARARSRHCRILTGSLCLRSSQVAAHSTCSRAPPRRA
jgi:hypothetical protein